jgi:hypothetical protein
MYTWKAISFFFTDNVYFETHLQSPIFLSGDAAIHQTPKKKTWFGGNELLVNGCLILWVGEGIIMNVQSISEALYRFVIFWRHVLDFFSACPLCISPRCGRRKLQQIAEHSKVAGRKKKCGYLTWLREITMLIGRSSWITFLWVIFHSYVV